MESESVSLSSGVKWKCTGSARVAPFLSRIFFNIACFLPLRQRATCCQSQTRRPPVQDRGKTKRTLLCTDELSSVDWSWSVPVWTPADRDVGDGAHGGFTRPLVYRCTPLSFTVTSGGRWGREAVIQPSLSTWITDGCTWLQLQSFHCSSVMLM